jgi:hypothetical protein
MVYFLAASDRLPKPPHSPGFNKIEEVWTMRTLLRVSIPVEKGNEAIKSEVLPQTFQSVMEALRVRGSCRRRSSRCSRTSTQPSF